MRVIRTVEEMRRARASLSGPVAMMATLGGMHAGHEALLERAGREGAALVASLFLNPAQFDDASDLDTYPADTRHDLEIFERNGVDVVFHPSVGEMYPDGPSMEIDPGALGRVLEGERRPGHFRGVVTVVAKILTVLRPDVAVWGAKDAQQNVILRRLTTDLLMPVRHVVVPTVRDTDGLALSSRNARLSAKERRAAPILYRALDEARIVWRDGETEADALRSIVRARVSGEPLARLEYVSLADPDTLEELDDASAGGLLSLAALLGSTRLIDNVVLRG